MTETDVQATQAAALGRLCRQAIDRALMPWGEWIRDWDTRDPIPAVERRKWQEACDEAAADAVAYARRAAWVAMR